MDELLTLIDAIKQKITDQEYRDIMKAMTALHNQEQNATDTKYLSEIYQIVLNEQIPDDRSCEGDPHECCDPRCTYGKLRYCINNMLVHVGRQQLINEGAIPY